MKRVDPAHLSMPRKKPLRIERELQASLVDFYRAAVWPGHSILFAVPNGEERNEAVAKMLTGITEKRRETFQDSEYLTPYGQGVIPGPPDLILLTENATTLVEAKRPAQTLNVAGKTVKTRAGSLSRGQRLFRERATFLHHDYRIISSLEDWANLLGEKGLKLRVRLQEFSHFPKNSNM